MIVVQSCCEAILYVVSNYALPLKADKGQDWCVKLQTKIFEVAFVLFVGLGFLGGGGWFCFWFFFAVVLFCFSL